MSPIQHFSQPSEPRNRALRQPPLAVNADEALIEAFLDITASYLALPLSADCGIGSAPFQFFQFGCRFLAVSCASSPHALQ